MTDASTAPTTPFDRSTPAHAALARVIETAGSFAGSIQVLVGPSHVPARRATAAQILGGRFLELDTAGTLADKPHAGRFLVGYHVDGKELVGCWVDSFHTGTDLMACAGEHTADGKLVLRGSYGAGEERWGWRTTFKLADDILEIEATNVAPDGTEDRAILTTLRRISA